MPRPWAAPLPRPAARILLAGGLTLAGWLLGAALSGSTASADTVQQPDSATCAARPSSDVSALPHAKKAPEHGLLRAHRAKHAKPGDCSPQPPAAEPSGDQQTGESPSTGDELPADQTATDQTAPAGEQPEVQVEGVQTESAAEQPAAKHRRTTTTSSSSSSSSSGNGLLGGLLGSIVDALGGTLNAVTGAVGTVGHTVLAPLAEPAASNPDAPVLLPINDILDPVLSGGSSSSGSVTATVPGKSATITADVPGTATVPAPAAVSQPQTTTRGPLAHFVIIRSHELPASQEKPRDSGIHARGGGGDSGPGLPGGSSAPSAPATTSISAGHDGPGGARPQFAVHTDDSTTTQLRLIGSSLDHEVDGAGREAALPTTSPD